MAVINSETVWTGGLNAAALAGQTLPVPGFYDTTLRDGEQAVGVIFDPDQKLEIAKWVDSLGVARIEAGFPRVSDDDKEAIRKIMKAGLSAELWGFSRALVPDVEAVADLGLKACVIEAPVADGKLNALNVSREKVLERVKTSVSFAVKQGIKVAYFGVDATRADLAFLETVYKSAQDCGASEFVVVDTMGVGTPEGISFLINTMRGWFGPNTPIHFHGHNDFGLGTANAVAAVKAGAQWIHGTIDGIGERGGNANIPEIAMALALLYGCDTGLNLDRIREASEYLRGIARYALEPWKPVVGANLFVRETGAVAAQFHLPHAIEPYSSTILNTPRAIVLGKKSGAASIEIKAAQLGLRINPEKAGELLQAVKSHAIAHRRLVTDDEFIKLAEPFK